MVELLYPVTTLTASAVLTIIYCHDRSVSSGRKNLDRAYRSLLAWVIFFGIQDAGWGLFAGPLFNSQVLTYVISVVFHVSTVTTAFLWLNYVLAYLNWDGKQRVFCLWLGGMVFLTQCGILFYNFFDPVLFEVLQDGTYVGGRLRTQISFLQYLIYLLIGIISLAAAVRKEGKEKNKYYLILSFILAPIIAGILQFCFMNGPFYTIGYLIGCVIIHSFIVSREQKDQKQKLQEAKQEAERSNRAKSAFLFNMSHDMRTPMNAIVGYTELARKSINDPERMTEYLDKIVLAEEGLLALVNNVLEMARIENDKVVIRETATDIRSAVDKIRMIIEGEAKKKNITLVSYCDVYYPYLIQDEFRNAEVVHNIISNAIKYTKEGGTVEFGLRQLPGQTEQDCVIEFTCKDNGIGMSEEFLAHAFDSFEREWTVTNSGIQGSGLGLGIVKRLLELMGGTIEIESKQGVGTTVITRTPHRFAKPEDVQEEHVREELFDSELEGRRILLVEDNEMNREIADEILKAGGFMVENAEDGKEACELLLRKGAGYYDLVLMDIQMPVMDGYEATRTIRGFEDEILAHVPIVAMTANAFEEDRVASMKAGMDDHVSKPIDTGVLKQVLRKVLLHEMQEKAKS